MSGITDITQDEYILGASNNTAIGNVTDSLKVHVSNSLNYRDEINNQIVAQNAFSSLASDITVGNNESNIFYLKNISLTKTIYIFDLYCVPDTSNQNNWMEFYIYYNPTVTANGTALTSVNLYAGSANTSSAQVFSAPNATNRGAKVSIIFAGNNNAASPSLFHSTNYYLILPPGAGLLISGISKANGQKAYINTAWFEV